MLVTPVHIPTIHVVQFDMTYKMRSWRIHDGLTVVIMRESDFQCNHIQANVYYICNSSTTGMNALPDIYTCA